MDSWATVTLFHVVQLLVPLHQISFPMLALVRSAFFDPSKIATTSTSHKDCCNKGRMLVSLEGESSFAIAVASGCCFTCALLETQAV
eukprot:6227803-Amphidinium_carterae.1